MSANDRLGWILVGGFAFAVAFQWSLRPIWNVIEAAIGRIHNPRELVAENARLRACLEQSRRECESLRADAEHRAGLGMLVGMED